MPETPPIPSPVEDLGDRPFAFYPPILSIDHNEWRYLRSTWSEILVANTKSEQELWIPRRYLGNVSAVDEPVRILGLSRELEYRGGMLRPHERRVLNMPASPSPSSLPPGEADPPARLKRPRSVSSPSEERIGRLILWALAIGITATIVLIWAFRGEEPQAVATTSVSDNTYLDLARGDDFYQIVRRLGKPASDRWRTNSGELQVRALGYPQRGYTVLLMGTERDSATYIGTMNKSWQPIHFVGLPNGGDTASFLRGIERF